MKKTITIICLLGLFLTAAVTSLKWRQISDVTPTITEINFVDGVTAPIQQQLNDKPNISDGFMLTDTFPRRSEITTLITNYISTYLGGLYKSGTDNLLHYQHGNYDYTLQKKDSTIIPNWSGLLTGLAFAATFEEASGTTANDVIGSFTGAISGDVTVNVAGKIGKCYQFGGTNGWINFGNHVEHRWAENYTISSWVNLTNIEITRYLLAKQFALRFISDERAVVEQGNLSPSAYTTNSITAGQWVNIIQEVTATSVKIYVNGTLATTTAVSGSLYNGYLSDFIIGSSNGSGSFYKGLVDDILIWNRLLSQTEINRYLNGGTPLTVGGM